MSTLSPAEYAGEFPDTRLVQWLQFSGEERKIVRRRLRTDGTISRLPENFRHAARIPFALFKTNLRDPLYATDISHDNYLQ